MKQDKDLLCRCRHLWEGMGAFRARRGASLDLAYGRHWQREITLPDGRIITEEREMRSRGKRPITNNLTRQLIKTVVGKWRFLRSRHHCSDGDETHALGQALMGSGEKDLADARALEEFLISGLTAQRYDKERGEWENISPGRLLLAPFMREDGGDCRMMGILHDMHRGEVLRRFGCGNALQMANLLASLRQNGGTDSVRFSESEDVMFDRSSRCDMVRIIEVWHRNVTGILRIHDAESGQYFVAESDERLVSGLTELNQQRQAEGRNSVKIVVDVADLWVHTWLTPSGEILESETLGEGERPALVMRGYPMIDGEIHSLVEDIRPQQEYVNRLVQLLDETIEHSAKGVLLYPTDQLPHGMTWEELRRIWSTPGSIIPFMRNSKNITPIQVDTAGTSVGAAEMLHTQLDLFGRISGTTFATAVSGMNVNSADMLRRQMEQEAVSLLDILSSFEAFLVTRDNYNKYARNQSENRGGDAAGREDTKAR